MATKFWKPIFSSKLIVLTYYVNDILIRACFISYIFFIEESMQAVWTCQPISIGYDFFGAVRRHRPNKISKFGLLQVIDV